MTESKSADRAQLLQFSRIFAGFGIIISGISFYRHGALTNLALGVAVVGLLIGLIGAIRPESLNWLYFKWIAFGEKLAIIVSKVVVVLTFFLVITPVALLLKLIGKDILAMRLEGGKASSYFTKPDPSIANRHETPF